MNPPGFTLDKIKFGTDKPTFDKAVELYQQGKVTGVREGIQSYSGIVLGTEPYQVLVEARNYQYANCTCYLGQKDVLCKHIVALALYIVKDGEVLSSEETEQFASPACSHIVRQPSVEELSTTKKGISAAMRYIKPYDGPSRTWFANQHSLEEGCSRLSAIIAKLPVHLDTAKLLVELLLRLDKKLQFGGVDDSNGIVSGFMYELVEVLEEYVKFDPACTFAFSKLAGIESCFGWEEPLVKIIDEQE